MLISSISIRDLPPPRHLHQALHHRQLHRLLRYPLRQAPQTLTNTVTRGMPGIVAGPLGVAGFVTHMNCAMGTIHASAAPITQHTQLGPSPLPRQRGAAATTEPQGSANPSLQFRFVSCWSSVLCSSVTVAFSFSSSFSTRTSATCCSPTSLAAF